MKNRFVVTLGLAAVAAGAAAALHPRSGVLALAVQAQAAQPHGVISGVVIDGTTKRPVSGADVQLTGGAAGAGGRRTTTDAQGRFSFDGLPAGNQYSVVVSRVGYFDSRYGHFGQRMPGRLSGALIVLRENEVFADANVYLFRPASIGGTVVDPRGQPVSGAQVRVLSRAIVAGASRLNGGRGVVTDERGAYRITGLTAGDYIVEAAAVPPAPDAAMGSVSVRDRATDLAATAARLRIVYPGSRSIQDAVPVRVDFGEDRGSVDFTLPAVEVRRIAGRLDGPPDAFGAVAIRLVPEGSEPGGARQDAAVTVADDSGGFLFTNVPAGRYAVRAVPGVVDLGGSQDRIPNHDGSFKYVTLDDVLSFTFVRFFRSGTRELPSIGRREPRVEPPAYWGDAPVDVDARDPRPTIDVTVALQPMARIAGRVVMEPGAPGFVSFMVLPADADPDSGWAMTEVFGEAPFVLDGLPPGRYFLRSRGLDNPIKSIEWAGRDYIDAPLDLQHGRDVTDVVVTLTGNRARLNGSVVDAAGRPAMAASVIYFPANPDSWRDFGIISPRIGRSFVRPSGQFNTPPLPAGEYGVVAVELGLRAPWHDARFLAAVAGQATRVKVGWGETRTLALRVQPSPVR